MSRKVPADARGRLSATRLRTFERWLVGLLLLCGLVVVVLHRSEIEQFARLAREARPVWLWAGVALQVGTYFCVAGAWGVALRRMGRPVSLPSLGWLAVAKLFSDQAMPSGGMSGTAFLVTALKRRGIPNPVCLATLLVSIVSSYAANLLAAAASLLLLWWFHKLQPWIWVVAAIFCVVSVAIPSVALGLRRWGRGGLPRWTRRVPLAGRFLGLLGEAPDDLLRAPAVVGAATAFQLGVILLDAATLWIMLLAVGHPEALGLALPSFFLASMVAMIGPIPLGLGTFEATCVTMLHVGGVPVAAALTATLLFRGLSMWLPMLPGMWLARRELAGRGVTPGAG
jgi:uncharacterized membrane protein YbhN (UPF0104 family)